MSEKDILGDLLASEKSLTINMGYALNEASSKAIYQFYLDMFLEINKTCKEIFNLMYKNGYYQLSNVDKTKKNQCIKKIKKDF